MKAEQSVLILSGEHEKSPPGEGGLPGVYLGEISVCEELSSSPNPTKAPSRTCPCPSP
jgi:hypothetical protein